MADKTTPTSPKPEVHVDPKFQKALDQVRAALPDDKRANFDRAVEQEKASVRDHQHGGALARELTFDLTMYPDKIAPVLPQLVNDPQAAKTLIKNLHDIGFDVSQKVNAASKRDTSSMPPEKVAEAKVELQGYVSANLAVHGSILREIGYAISDAAHQSITATEPPPEIVKSRPKSAKHR